MEMFGSKWIAKAKEIMDRIETTQSENIVKAATVMADAIEAERWVHMFGAGHAHIPLEEVYPRTGGFVGFHPIGEMALTYFTNVVGDSGVRQFCFLERVEGYGRVIMQNYDLDPRDVMWIFSHSGINCVVIDVALAAKEQGATVVATTSLEHSKQTESRHSSGKKLYEVADIVIDSCVPFGDAMIEVPGLEQKVGPGSTLGFITVANAVVTTVADILTKRGVKLYVNATLNVKGDRIAEDLVEIGTREYKRRAKGF
ncbi:MAG: SIS domain-containing protein [Armatimonadota bacterium]|nr:SIS domain-containing protein [Armatimonadota bacterium]